MLCCLRVRLWTLSRKTAGARPHQDTQTKALRHKEETLEVDTVLLTETEEELLEVITLVILTNRVRLLRLQDRMVQDMEETVEEDMDTMKDESREKEEVEEITQEKTTTQTEKTTLILIPTITDKETNLLHHHHILNNLSRQHLFQQSRQHCWRTWKKGCLFP